MYLIMEKEEFSKIRFSPYKLILFIVKKMF